MTPLYRRLREIARRPHGDLDQFASSERGRIDRDEVLFVQGGYVPRGGRVNDECREGFFEEDATFLFHFGVDLEKGGVSQERTGRVGRVKLQRTLSAST